MIPPKTRLLVVDDHAVNRQLLCLSLEKSGFDVIDCRDGAEALQIVENNGPMLLVLDYEMPEFNGAQVCELIRKHGNPAIAGLPIILLTGHTGEDHEVECLRAGADDFVTKPINAQILKARIDTHLRLHAMRAQLQEQNDELENWRRLHELDLAAARITQQAIIPQRMPKIAGWELAAHYAPVIQVGGDIYDWLRLPDRRWLCWIADATGHGVSAALLTTLTKLVFRHAALEADSPAGILREVNTEFHAIFRGSSFMTAACCAFGEADGELKFAGAGHPPLLIRHARGVESIASQSPPVGIVADLEISEASFHLEPGDTALLYTDGLLSPSSSDRHHLTPDELQPLLPEKALSVTDFLHQVIYSVTALGSHEPLPDDLAAVAVRRV